MTQRAENGPPLGPETCPSLCVERSHPGSEHDPAEHGCYCWELCSMGPTCPGANAGLDRGCWRTRALMRCAMTSTTTLLPFQPATMTPAQLAAVSFLARYSGHTHITS